MLHIIKINNFLFLLCIYYKFQIMSKRATKERLFEVTGRLDKTFKPKLNENIFDRFTIEVSQPDYKGTIKRDRTGWMLYDVTGSPEEAGPFGDLTSLIDYYDIDKSQMSGGYVKNLRENEVAPENLAVSQIGGVVEKSEINEASSLSPIHNYVYFAYNFPSDFIEKVWASNQNIMEHLKNKFAAYYSKYGAEGVMNRFYVELDNENQKILEDWIMANYHG
jgi:hypothetical protein